MFLKKVFFSGLFVLFLLGCKTSKLSRTLSKKVNTSFFDNQFTGIYIYDLNADKALYNYNGNKYFTPASNTKIFTLFTGLQLLPDSIPSFKYFIEKDTITIQGTGDPTLFHPYFKDSTVYNKVKGFARINLIIDNIIDKRYAPGWAWEDFDSYYSPERNAFPMYGNVVAFHKSDSLIVTPKFIEKSLKLTDNFSGREEFSNTFYFKKNRKKEMKIPMIMDSTLIFNLWNDVLPDKVQIIKSKNINQFSTAYSVSSDSLYKRMMEVSDNFLAEQILVLASSTLSDTLNTSKVRKYMLENALAHLEQPPRWVDGSGLSRYNLFTPASFVTVLTEMYKTVDKDRLFNLFSVGGKFGTLKDWYLGTENPYVYAKTGTLGNNHNLSGYLITNSGNVLVFSYMNNHYKHSNTAVKEQMQTIFEWLRDNY